MNILKVLDKHLEEWILVFIYGVMLFVATAQIIFRYIINKSLSWSQDFLIYLLIWSVFIGISLAVKRRKHIRVELAYSVLSKKAQLYLKVFSNLIFIAFCAIISVYSFIKVYKLIFVNPQVSESTGLSMWMVQIAVPLGFTLSIYRLIVDTKLLFKEKDGEKGGTK